MPNSIRISAKVYKRMQAIKHELERERSGPVSMSTVVEYLLDSIR